MGTYDTPSGAPISPNDPVYCPSEQEEGILEAVEVAKGARLALREAEQSLAAKLKALILPDLAPGTILNIAGRGPGYRAKVSAGRGYRFDFKLLTELAVTVDSSRPSLSGWIVKAVSWDVDANKGVGQPVSLRGYVFPLAFMNTSETEEEYLSNAISMLEAKRNGVVHG
jgi:hypothetical protein